MDKPLESYCKLLLIILAGQILSPVSSAILNTQRFSSNSGDISVSSPDNVNTKLHLLPPNVPASLAQRMIKSGPVMEIQGNERTVSNQPLIDKVLDYQEKGMAIANPAVAQGAPYNQPRSLQMNSGSLNLQSIIDSVMNKKPEPTAQPGIPFNINPKIVYEKPDKPHMHRRRNQRHLNSPIGSVSYPYGPPASITPNFLPPTVLNVNYANKEVRKNVANAVQIRDPTTKPYFNTLVDENVLATGVNAMSSFTKSNSELKKLQDKIAEATEKLYETKTISNQANSEMMIRISKLQDLIRSFKEIS